MNFEWEKKKKIMVSTAATDSASKSVSPITKHIPMTDIYDLKEEKK
jgi:hypothetical protein